MNEKQILRLWATSTLAVGLLIVTCGLLMRMAMLEKRVTRLSFAAYYGPAAYKR